MLLFKSKFYPIFSILIGIVCLFIVNIIPKGNFIATSFYTIGVYFPLIAIQILLVIYHQKKSGNILSITTVTISILVFIIILIRYLLTTS